MATEIKLPELGENLEGGDVLDVRVEAGAVVTKGQALLEIEAEKSTVEVPSPLDGRVSKFLVKKGDHVQVGQLLCLIDDGETAKDAESQTGAAAKPAPAMGESKPSKESTLVKPAAESRPTTKSEVGPAKEVPAASAVKPVAAKAAVTSSNKPVPAGPATRRLARELGVDLHHVAGSASHGRITAEDVKAFVRETPPGKANHTAGAGPPPLPDFERWGPIERQSLDAVRRRTAEQMALAWRLVPHVTHHDVADVTDLDAFRRQQEGRGPKLTITAFALKAAAVALKQFPRCNASLDLADNQVIFKRYYHIGVAVDTERGLLVPVIRDVDGKSIAELAQELADVAERARQKKLTPDDMRGGTFTISNLGGIGGTAFSPIVNYPEVAILGLVRSRLQPVVRDGEIVPRLLLPLCVSYDHRVIDGAEAARFTRRLAELLENPLQMLMHA